ncbi:DsrC-like protein [Candidatus Koribacter versatilis Ellin345]|uniref:DsrC-like protein n=1 Tax=Koribacter versatilis (strain Ellin345) TaxID=204669 RepID=Q1IU10_KORVE|nr:TusE/DsrC/DsvC family sulfur relay protein [Candidatus Koribacter versatilis]ABF39640.1 DsrC-like protein [Candidatus Koribacter versatilis Ellin345]
MITAELRKFAWNDRDVDVDDDGFILQPELWDATLALVLAQTDGVNELSEAHWKIIHYVRAYFREHGAVPTVRAMCSESQISLRGFYELFPAGPIRGACRIAGLPKPSGCV